MTVDPWKSEARRNLADNPPGRLPLAAFFKPEYRQAVFTRAELKSRRKRSQILEVYPKTRFDYSGLDDSTVDYYWYIGEPMAIFPTFYFHLLRDRIGTVFDRSYSFVKRGSQMATVRSPPPLLLVLADMFRRSEVVRLTGEAVRAVQNKYTLFEKNISCEEEHHLAEDILDESLPDFLERMEPLFMECKLRQGHCFSLTNVVD